MRLIQESDLNLKGKRVILRCDFNVPLNEKGEVADDFRIQKTIPTIEFLLKRGAKIILLSHLGKPEGKRIKKFSLSPIQEKLLEFLDLSIVKANDCIGKGIEKWTCQMQEGEILLLENLRFYKGEEENDIDFAKKLAPLGDIYVNDAFSCAHRKHASIVSLPQLLPSFAGLLFQEEVNNLSRILKKPKRPVVAIVGGFKAESKIEPINEFLDLYDYVLIGGRIANLILAVKGLITGRPFPKEEVVKEIEGIDITNSKLRLPVDLKVSPDKKGKIYTRVGAPAGVRKEEMILDIGPETINVFSRIIKEAKTIFWSGPLGFIEEKIFSFGSFAIAKAITETNSFSVAGGGDTNAFLKQSGFLNKFSYISTGGGAMLKFLAGKELPGIAVLENK